MSVPEGLGAHHRRRRDRLHRQLEHRAYRDYAPSPPHPIPSRFSVDELPAIASSTPGYRFGTVSLVPRKAGPVMLITYQGARREPGHRQNRDRRDRALRVLAGRPRSDPDPVRPGRRRQRRPVADHHRFPAVAVTAQPATPPALEARSLYRFYRAGDEETLALQGVSLRLEAGEFVAVAGPSGSGKSTLLACLAGMDNPDGGIVRIAGQRISHRPEPERARIRARHIGMLFQNANLLDHLTVAQNLSLVRSLPDVPTGGSARPAEAARLSAGPLPIPASSPAGELARAGLAVALANSPPRCLADEPTGELDSVTESRVLDLLFAAARPRHRDPRGQP